MRLYGLGRRRVLACLALVVDDGHNVKTPLVVHGPKAVYARQRYDRCEHLLRLAYDVDERTEHVAPLLVIRRLGVYLLKEHQDVLEQQGRQLDYFLDVQLPFQFALVN